LAAVVPELRHILEGCERADSLVLNPHKWLFTPFDLSVLYTRPMDPLHRACALVPEYLRTLEHGPEAVRNHSEYSIQLGRPFRALKLWMGIRYFGRNGLAARIREHPPSPRNSGRKSPARSRSKWHPKRTGSRSRSWSDWS
jgi:aromatic-L-amino-acid decarboxylase